MAKRKRSSDAPARSSIFTSLDPSEPAASFAASSPYPHVQLATIVEQPLLLKVREELQLLRSTFKETDLFKVFQTGDLANVDPSNAEHAAALPTTIELRAALYSERFRNFVRAVTGCAPLTAQTDCSCNVYRRGGHLLCHDDVIGTRCVSYILYLSRPGKRWRQQLGGALELYALDAISGEVLPSPVDAIAPEFGTMVLFTVKPGVSYHSVQEVGSKAPRLSISGWFHAANPPEGADSAASLAQLQSAAAHVPAKAIKKPPAPRRSLLPAEERRLAAMINPAYLQPSTLKAVRAQLQQQGAALLSAFLQPTFAEAIKEKARACDLKDGLSKGVIPEHAAGTQRKGWRIIGPPQLRRYMRFKAPKQKKSNQQEGNGDCGAASSSSSGGGTTGNGGGQGGGSSSSSVGLLLEEVRLLMHSAAFVQLLSVLSGLTPSSCASEVRRFRPGLDYTLAHVGTQRSAGTLDATLAFVSDAPSELALWDSGDVGGFECHVESSAEDAHGAAEVYRAGEDTAGVTSIHATQNALSLVLRRPDTMKFVKYVSAAAPGSRWDVAAEYSQ